MPHPGDTTMTGAAATLTDAAAPAMSAYAGLTHYPEHVAWHQSFAATPVYALLDDAVRRHGSKACAFFLGRTLSYREIGILVERTAAGLQALGIRKGTKVGLLMPN